ncbi:hypothetical protein SAMN06269250_4493 [Spirosoma fluviale]|uniref:Uncharacterized protein n=1 Tax=Spirosoma fluviale TaxID=1597977 RepID=A0A286GE72_9BACT|nr:hypothetical protein SAMN06269250_4493 [Spirosoma fluviale]
MIIELNFTGASLCDRKLTVFLHLLCKKPGFALINNSNKWIYLRNYVTT